jgi:hypothetical protein
MGSVFNWNGELKLTAPSALLSSHDEARSELARARMEGGPIAEAAMQVARLCLPHFGHLGNTLFGSPISCAAQASGFPLK